MDSAQLLAVTLPTIPLRFYTGLFAAFLFSVLAAESAESRRKTFDIPPGDASVTLKLFVEQSGEQVIYIVDRVRGVSTHRLRGEMPTRNALDVMLAGTELFVLVDQESNSWVISRRRSNEMPSELREEEPAKPPPKSAPVRKQQKAPVTTEDVLVRLPTFSVSSERDSSYIGKEALSTTRTGVDLADVPQSIIVLNQTFLADLNPTILAKALSYVGGAQVGTISWSVDRYMIRGFVGEGDYVDGFRTQTDKNTDLNLIDRIEIIKGPSAIFIANQAATVGGVINKISKSPTAYRLANLTLQVGRWDSNRADLDLSGPITTDQKLMYRLLIAGQDSDGYYDSTYEKRFSIVPMVRYQFSRDTDLWLKFEVFDSVYSSYNGLPLDGRTNQIVDLPRQRNLGEGPPHNWRTDRFWRAWGQFSTRFNEHAAMRLAFFDSVDQQRRVESIVAPSGGTISNGVLTPQYVIPPTYVVGQTLPRFTTAIGPDKQPRREIQNDYVFNFASGPASHKLLIGANFVRHPQETSTFSSSSTSTATSSPINPFDPQRSPGVFVDFSQPPSNFTSRNQTFSKAYVLETASFLDNRLIVSLGASKNRFAFSQTTTGFDQRTATALAPTVVPKQTLHKNLLQYGVVLKPLSNVSVFYGYNKNFSNNGLSVANTLLPPQEGEQKEFGLKSEWLDGKFSFSMNYFAVVQLNNSVPAFPQTTPPSNTLVNGTESRGFDGDFSASLSENLDLIGSFAVFDAKVPLPEPWRAVQHPYDGRARTEIPVNNASERNFSLWVRYKFTGNALKGLALGVGVNYLHKRAITDNSNQVLYGYLPARTLVDATISYETKRARYQLNFDNVFNRDYIYAARSNQILVPGLPLNIRASATFRF